MPMKEAMAPREVVQRLSHREHILVRPDSYVGPTPQQEDVYWVREGDHFVKKRQTVSPALLKIFDEILVNAIDRNTSHPKEVKRIDVSLSETGHLTVVNNGPLGGISVEPHPTEGLWNPELTFGHLLTSTNYDDRQEKIVGGRNGYGAKLANVYSKEFEVRILDGTNKREYHQVWRDNMSQRGEAVISSYRKAANEVSITFLPDWGRFGMKGLTPDFSRLVEKRVWDASFYTTGCKVSWQGEELPKLDIKTYARMHLPPGAEVVVSTQERWQVAVAACPNDAFEQVSWVNGVCTYKGGSHVTHVVTQVTDGVLETLGKRCTLKGHQVKNTLFVMVKATLVNPTFSSQVKDECTLKVGQFGSRWEPVKTFHKQVLQKTGIQAEIDAMNRVKVEKELKKTDGSRLRARITGIPKLDDANWAGTSKGDQCTLILTEGDSAKALAVAGLTVVGRDRYGVFPLRGKPKNIRDCSAEQVTANGEFNSVKQILGLKHGHTYTSLKELRYGRMMIMTDADNDGSHIKGLVLNNIHALWPELINLGFVVSMVTPIIKATRGAQSKWFFTENAYREWWDTRPQGWKIKYYKGLGTSTAVEAKEYFRAIDRLTVRFDADETTDDVMTLAFDRSQADARKRWLTRASEESKTLSVPYGDVRELSVSKFITRDMVHFSLADLHRSIPSMMDGLKPSQRKVIFAAFKRNLTQDVKVAQFAAYTAEHTAYHHGEVSLADTIVRLAQDYVGSNNINLLYPSGQFGTRLLGGKDASQTRYIFTRLTPEARRLFDRRDTELLPAVVDDGHRVEPEYYAPILPMALVNGCEGIGTGFSCYVPPYNPADLKANLERVMQGEPLQKMTPWFRGFTGTLQQDGEHAWVAEGVASASGDKLTITELPPGVWTDPFKDHLDAMIERKKIASYRNSSTTQDVRFEIFGYTGADVMRDFKLRKTFHTSNMHLFHPRHGIKRYQSPEEILTDYAEIRVDVYNARKKAMVSELTHEADRLSEKARFIEEVCSGDIQVFRVRRAALEADLTRRKFREVEYLLATRTYEYTEEEVMALRQRALEAREELARIKAMSVIDMWQKDLSEM